MWLLWSITVLMITLGVLYVISPDSCAKMFRLIRAKLWYRADTIEGAHAVEGAAYAINQLKQQVHTHKDSLVTAQAGLASTKRAYQLKANAVDLLTQQITARKSALVTNGGTLATDSVALDLAKKLMQANQEKNRMEEQVRLQEETYNSVLQKFKETIARIGEMESKHGALAVELKMSQMTADLADFERKVGDDASLTSGLSTVNDLTLKIEDAIMRNKAKVAVESQLSPPSESDDWVRQQAAEDLLKTF